MGFFFFSQDNFKGGYVATFPIPNRKYHNEYKTWMSNFPIFLPFLVSPQDYIFIY